MEDSNFSKAALNLWCSKKKLKVEYDFSKVNDLFKCEIRISSINHVSADLGQSKKVAANNSALKFLNYLVEKKYMSEIDLSLPCFEQLSIKDKLFSNADSNGGPPNTSANRFSGSFGGGGDSHESRRRPFSNRKVYQPLIPPDSNPPRNSFHQPPPPARFPPPPSGPPMRGPPHMGPSNENFYRNFPSRPPPNRPPYYDADPSQRYNNRTLNYHPDLEYPRKNGPDYNNGYGMPSRPAPSNANDYYNDYMKKIKFDKQEKIKENIGNFTLDNSKQQLNIFFQVNKIKADYVYDSYGPQHQKVFVATLKFRIPRTKKEYFFKQTGNSKQDASRTCALAVLHELYREGLVDKFEPDAPSKRQLMKMSLIYDVKVASELKEDMQSAYNYILFCTQNNPMNYIPQPSTPSYGYLYWCAPMDNFNPWTNTNLDGTIFASKTKDEIDVILHSEFTSMIKSESFQKILTTRSKLPIWKYKDNLISLIQKNPVIIIKGSTGCGKTTQVPQFILDTFIKNGNGSNCNIIVTQPRRISAISIAERICYERVDSMKELVGSVGYSVRFDHIYPRPYGSILFCTTGHLLRRIQGGLKGISHLIIDEVHERDVNTDLLLTIVRDLIKMNLDIRIIIMSATLGVSHFQKYFNHCDAIEIDNPVFPVSRYYLEDCIELLKWKPKKLSYLEDDIDIENTEDTLIEFDFNKNYSASTIEMLRSLKEGVICYELVIGLLEYIDSMYITGSILIFMPGWNAIFALINCLREHHIFGNSNKFLLLPLHSQLSHKDNNKIFQRSVQRKIIISTNIAETSITIDDVVFVIDTCLIKRKIYCPQTNVTSYIIDWVSKSNIQQRQGRAGRVRSGYFFVLCSKKRFKLLEEFKMPEILVTSLVETSLLIKYLGFGSVPDFLKRTIDPPSNQSIDEAMRLLQDINAFDSHNELTPLGLILAKMPLDPRIGKMVIQSLLLDVASPIITIAAAVAANMEIFDHNDLDLYLQTLSTLDEERYSDHLIFFKAFNMCSTSSLNQNSYRCINPNAISVIENVRRQMIDILKKCDFKEQLFVTRPMYTKNELDLISGLLVTAFYPNVCIHKESRKILTNEERIGLVHKTSIIYSYVVSNKISKCTKLASPLFIYSEKTSNRNLISSKQMSMISFLHLLLLGVKKFEFPANTESHLNTIVLDGWIEIKIDPQAFDCIWQIKTEFENVLSRACENPKNLETMSNLDNSVLTIVRHICYFENVSVDVTVK